jgi:hypothetical protein
MLFFPILQLGFSPRMAQFLVFTIAYHLNPGWKPEALINYPILQELSAKQ